MKQSRKALKERVSGTLFLLMLCWLSGGPTTVAQNVNREVQNDNAMNQNRRILRIPDIRGFITLKGDFHVHTSFSDGYVWPDFRVTEAWTEGLDVIAITDHIESRPHKMDTSDDQNSGYERAIARAGALNILLVPGAEISKKIPPGHLNALFVEDVNKLTDNDPMVQIEEAVKQGAFILWNHPGWGWASPLPDTTTWWDFQTVILEKGWLHGIEIYNTEEWYQIALKWCMEKSLTVFANSDIHAPVNYWYDLSRPYSHRPITLVFARERSLNGVKEALFEKRTLGFFDHILAGREDLIKELFHASVTLHPPFRQSGKDGNRTFYAELENHSDLTFILKKEGKAKRNDRSDIIKLFPESIAIINYKEAEEELDYSLTNCYSNINEHTIIQIPVRK